MAEVGFTLLQQLGTTTAVLPWVGFFRLLGVAFLFTSLTVALTVVVRTCGRRSTFCATIFRAESYSGEM